MLATWDETRTNPNPAQNPDGTAPWGFLLLTDCRWVLWRWHGGRGGHCALQWVWEDFYGEDSPCKKV